jgi:leucyl aminopeptidase
MEFSIKSGSPEKQRAACVIVGVYESRRLTFAAELIDRAANGFLTDVLKRGDMEGKLGSTLLLHAVPNAMCDRVLLVGLGKEREFRAKEYREAIRASIKALTQTSATEAVSYLSELTVKKHDVEWMIEQATVVTLDTLYRFDRFKSKMEDAREPKKMTLAVPRRTDLADGEKGLARGLAIADGMRFTKDLGNLPGNVCTPSYLAEQARAMAEMVGAEAEILDEAAIRELGMGSFLSVAQGSDHPPHLIVLKHWGAKSRHDPPVVLVGKGITFDTGGISLKPGEAMDEMKFDMCGAASVLGAFRAAAAMQLPINLVAIVPTCENMPSGRAVKPGDIVTSMSGQTIEILNTDAEGRLILCDALTYAERFTPSAVVDVATLTGACVIALGHVTSGLFSNQDSLAKELLEAGEEVGDRAWLMPLFEEYHEQLKSPFADMANIGGRPGGSITAACFLSKFTKAYDWAHLDVAGTASGKGGKDKGATGRPVPLLVQFLQDRADVANGNVVRRGRPRREAVEAGSEE